MFTSSRRIGLSDYTRVKRFYADERTEDHLRVTAKFAPQLESPAAARAFVTETLQRWGGDWPVESVALIVSELATNAVLHARSAYEVELVRGDVLRIAVHDTSRRAPNFTHDSPTTSQTSGRGLPIVRALARRCGVDLGPNGKVVWAEIAR